jgi:hypothetical protein
MPSTTTESGPAVCCSTLPTRRPANGVCAEIPGAARPIPERPFSKALVLPGPVRHFSRLVCSVLSSSWPRSFGFFTWLTELERRSLLMAGSLGGAISMYYIGAYIKIADPVHHVTAKLSSGGISAMAFFYLWTSECRRSAQWSSARATHSHTLFCCDSTVCYGPSWNGTPWVSSIFFSLLHEPFFLKRVTEPAGGDLLTTRCQVFGSESFENAVRPATQCVVSASNWFFGFHYCTFHS